eukprot:scpid69661/ scgid23037/ 
METSLIACIVLASVLCGRTQAQSSPPAPTTHVPSAALSSRPQTMQVSSPPPTMQASSPSQTTPQIPSMPATSAGTSSPPRTGSLPSAGSPPPLTPAGSPPPLTPTGTLMPVGTTAPVPCRVGYWSSDCSMKCSCNGHPCHQQTGVCQCPRCFTGTSCNATAGNGDGRKCVKDFFNARTPKDVSTLQTEIQRLPRELAESDIETLMSDYAATSVNRIRSPRYDVIAKPGGGELAQVRCILVDSSARTTLTDKIKMGTIGATVIINDATNEVVMNKPYLG